MVLANIGSNGFYHAPLVISTRKMDSISYDKKNFSLNIKYRGYRNIVVNKKELMLLYSFLKVSKRVELRANKKNIGYKYIVDVRGGDGFDYELVSIKELGSLFLFLRGFHSFMELNKLPEQLLLYLNRTYSFYLDTYDSDSDEFNVECKIK